MLLLFAALGIIAALEAAWRFRSLADQLIDFGAVFVCAGIGVWALRRYLFLLNHAEVVANQADCPACKTYGRMDLLAADATGDSVQVRCRKCGHEWHIEG